MREKIGVMFGNPETTTGGNALKFYASVRLDIRRIGQIKDGDSLTGNRTKVKVVKNKLAPPFRTTEFDIMYGLGVSKTGEIIDIGTELGVVQKSGSWFSFHAERIGQGRDNARQFLREHPDLCRNLDGELRKVLGLENLQDQPRKAAAAASGGENPARKAV